MYGIAYLENDQIRYWENAQREHIYEKQGELEQQGMFVTPVFHKRYWYNYKYGIPDVIRDFKKDFRAAYDDKYVSLIRSVHDAYIPETAAVAEWEAALAEMQQTWGKECVETAKRYGIRWGLCYNSENR